MQIGTKIQPVCHVMSGKELVSRSGQGMEVIRCPHIFTSSFAGILLVRAGGVECVCLGNAVASAKVLRRLRFWYGIVLRGSSADSFLFGEE